VAPGASLLTPLSAGVSAPADLSFTSQVINKAEYLGYLYSVGQSPLKIMCTNTQLLS
jgi:hypothetical protein